MATILEYLSRRQSETGSVVVPDCGSAECGLCVVAADDVPCLACVTPAEGVRSITQLPNAAETLSTGTAVLLHSARFEAASTALQKKLWSCRWAFALTDQCRVEMIGDCLLLTDSVERYQLGPDGVFPFADESTLLVDWLADQHGYPRDLCVFDPFAGCGALCLAATSSARRFGIDINRRAVLYARQNAAINSLPAQFLAAHSLDDSSWRLTAGAGPRHLIVSNPPFAPCPLEFRGSLAVSSGGGDDGLFYVVGTLKGAMRRLLDFKFALMCYSLVGPAGVRVINAVHALDVDDRLGHVRWYHLEGELMWRVGGRKRIPSPLALSQVPMFQKGLGMLTAEPQELKWGWSKWVARYRA